jgi:hypothetical protein
MAGAGLIEPWWVLDRVVTLLTLALLALFHGAAAQIAGDAVGSRTPQWRLSSQRTSRPSAASSAKRISSVSSLP